MVKSGGEAERDGISRVMEDGFQVWRWEEAERDGISGVMEDGFQVWRWGFYCSFSVGHPILLLLLLLDQHRRLGLLRWVVVSADGFGSDGFDRRRSFLHEIGILSTAWLLKLLSWLCRGVRTETFLVCDCRG
jgi:hypothetical protein